MDYSAIKQLIFDFLANLEVIYLTIVFVAGVIFFSRIHPSKMLIPITIATGVALFLGLVLSRLHPDLEAIVLVKSIVVLWVGCFIGSFTIGRLFRR